MKKLADSSLAVGDIVLTTSSSVVSKTIRTATASDVSHAMIYVEHCSVIDASAEGVQARNTQRLFFENECAIYVLRSRIGLRPDQANDLVEFARSKIGAQYSVREAIGIFSDRNQGPSKRQFCSRLVAQAFRYIGHDLVVNPNFCSPNEIRNSPALFNVENAVTSATSEEQAKFDRLRDTTQAMRDATNSALNAAREKCKQIQSFQDLAQYLATNPDDDEFMCRAIESSGYLSVWNVNIENSPWQYDLSLMSKLPDAEIEAYCRAVLTNEKEGKNRYIANRSVYGQLSRQYGLRYFSLMYNLYDHLAFLHGKRIEVASGWLKQKRGETLL